jgi:hypothetical protein
MNDDWVRPINKPTLLATPATSPRPVLKLYCGQVEVANLKHRSNELRNQCANGFMWLPRLAGSLRTTPVMVMVCSALNWAVVRSM